MHSYGHYPTPFVRTHRCPFAVVLIRFDADTFGNSKSTLSPGCPRYVQQVVWVEAGVDAAVAGVSCFSSPDAEHIWESISKNMRRFGWETKTGQRKFSRRSNMSWESIDDSGGGNGGDGGDGGDGGAGGVGQFELFGKMVLVSDLVVAGFGTATDEYTPLKASELKFAAGDVFEVARCRSFLPEFWVVFDGKLI